MRILHIAPAIFGEGGVVGGAERYALELAKNMAGETPTRFVAFGDRPEQRQIGNLEVRVLGPASYVRGQRANPITASLLSEIRRADVVHCHQQHILASSLASLACRATGRKVFVSDLGGGGWDVSSYISTDRWYHGHLHISEYSRAVFGHTAKPWAHVIYGGVDTGKFSPDSSVERDGTVLFVGRLLPHKGVNDLIQAIPAGMRLEIIGRPYDSRYHQDSLSRHSLLLASLLSRPHIEYRRSYHTTLRFVLESGFENGRNPLRKCVHEILQEFSRPFVDEHSVRIEQLVGSANICLRLLHRRHVQKNQRLPQVMVCAKSANCAG